MLVTTAFMGFLGAFLGGFAKQIFHFLALKTGKKMSDQKELEATTIDTVLQLRDLASQYWCNPEETKEAQQVARLLGWLELLKWIYPKTFEKRAVSKREVDVAFHRLRKALTGGNFAEPKHEADPARAVDVEREAAVLLAVVQIEKSKIPTPLV